MWCAKPANEATRRPGRRARRSGVRRRDRCRRRGGNAGRGAAIGGAVGGLGAGTYKGVEADANYKSAFRNCNCMRNRGHNVID